MHAHIKSGMSLNEKRQELAFLDQEQMSLDNFVTSNYGNTRSIQTKNYLPVITQ